MATTTEQLREMSDALTAYRRRYRVGKKTLLRAIAESVDACGVRHGRKFIIERRFKRFGGLAVAPTWSPPQRGRGKIVSWCVIDWATGMAVCGLPGLSLQGARYFARRMTAKKIHLACVNVAANEARLAVLRRAMEMD